MNFATAAALRAAATAAAELLAIDGFDEDDGTEAPFHDSVEDGAAEVVAFLGGWEIGGG